MREAKIAASARSTARAPEVCHDGLGSPAGGRGLPVPGSGPTARRSASRPHRPDDARREDRRAWPARAAVPRLGRQGLAAHRGLPRRRAGRPSRTGDAATRPRPRSSRRRTASARPGTPTCCGASPRSRRRRRATSSRARATPRSGLIVRAPNADLARDPRWGRTEEVYGEDPFHAGTLAAAFTRGLQGDDPRYWKTAALLKHFLANSNEDGRTRSSSDFDERLWREYYAKPFEMAVRAGRLARADGRLQRGQRHAGPRAPDAARRRGARVGRRRHRLHRRRRPAAAGQRPQGLPRSARRPRPPASRPASTTSSTATRSR